MDLKDALMQTRIKIESHKSCVDPINDLDETGLALIHHAAILGKADSLQHLVDVGADVNVKDRTNRTPLALTANRGRVDCMRVLILASCNVNQREHAGGTALHAAARHCHPDAIRLLLSHGARSSIKDVKGMTPLHRLATRPCERTLRAAEALLSAADIDIEALEGTYGDSAATLAITFRNTSLLQYLVSKGASLALVDIHMRGILHMGAACAIAETLLYLHGLELSAPSASIDTELIDNQGRTAWDTLVFFIKAPSSMIRGQQRRPDQHEISAFILLYQGIRDRNLEHWISALEGALDALTLGDTDHAANLVSGIAKLKTQCHNHSAAGYYRGMQKEIQARGREAVGILEEEVETLKAELAHSLQDELAVVLRQVNAAGSENTQH